MEPDKILAEADRCVKCGYCLPHCPTYALSADEGESPRGRIALIQGFVTGAVDSQRLHDHLNSCLACRACEPACPSEVNYGKLITAVREIQNKNQKPASRLHQILPNILSRTPYITATSKLARIYQRLGMASLVNKLGGKAMRRLNQMIPDQLETTPWKETYSPTGKTTGRIGLFTGCIGRITDRPALLASIKILNKLGYEVIVPANQGCCGAMHLHSGDKDGADQLAKNNVDAFSGLDIEAIVGVATGCSSHLAGLESGGTPLAAPVMDISSFLCSTPGISEIELHPLNKRVAIHTPCSMKNVLKESHAPLQLLEQIPDIDLFQLPENGLCCGAAGLYVITNPENADALREDKITGLQKSKAEIVATSNTGCALHMAAGVRESGMEVEILHPIELLARQMPG